MTLDLASLRAMRKSSSATLQKISAELQKQDSSKYSADDSRFWRATVDKAGNGSAVIRFLPSIDPDALPWVKVYDHGFQGPTGKWYIENCRSTLGEPDPVVEYCNTLWNGSEDDKNLARKLKRRLSYYANVLIIKDPGNPDNEGKVFIFKFGKKLFDKIKGKLQPDFDDESPVDVFNPWEGANFRLRIRKVEGWSNTDKSEFESPSPIADDDEEILNILNQRHDLKFLTEPSRFKSYDDLKAKFEMVMNGQPSAGMKKAADMLLDDEEQEQELPKPSVKEVAEPKLTQKPKAPFEDEDDEDLSFFKDLIND